MQNKLFKKGLIVIITLLFIGIIINSALGIPNIVDDTTPPITTCTLEPPEPNGDNGWYVTDVYVTLNATDDISGVKEIFYRTTESEWLNHSGNYLIFILDDECLDSSIEFYSVDNAGNQEETKSIGINIDQLPPNIKVEVDKQKVNNSYLFTFFSWAEDDCSGICYLRFLLNGVEQDTVTGPGPIYVWQFLYSGGLKIKITIEAYDCAGNFASYDKQLNFKGNYLQKSINPLFLRFIKCFLLLNLLLLKHQI